MLNEPYAWRTDFLRVLLRFISSEQMTGGRILHELRPERIDNEIVKTVVTIARQWASQHQWTAPTLNELKQLAFRSMQEGNLTKAELAEVDLLLATVKKANSIGRDLLVEEVTKEVRMQALQDGIDNALKKMVTGSTEEAFEVLEQANLVGRDIALDAKEARIPEDLEKILKATAEAAQYDRIPSPVAELDAYMRGGVGPGELCVILAIPNGGKSTALCDTTVCTLLASRARVVYYTLEMSHKDVVVKITANLMGLEIDDVEKGKVSFFDLQQRTMRLLRDRDSRYVVRHAPPGTMSVKDIREHLRRLRVERDFTPTLVVVDYADVMTSGGKRDNSYIEQGDIYQGLKALAVDLNVPVLTASQAKRDAVDQRVLFIDSLADSFRKAHVSDYIIAICAQEDERTNDQLRLYIAKNRFGKAGVEIGPIATDFAKGRLALRGKPYSDEEFT